MYMSQCMCECQSTTCWRWFSPSAVWILELGSLGLTTSAFTHGAISTAQPGSILCNGGEKAELLYLYRNEETRNLRKQQLLE